MRCMPGGAWTAACPGSCSSLRPVLGGRRAARIGALGSSPGDRGPGTGLPEVFVHGCTLSVGTGPDRRGVVITGSSGAGKTTLVAGLLRHHGYPVAVPNDDWAAVSLARGDSVSTGEQMLHMKTGSVLALRPGFSPARRRARTRGICPSGIGPPGCWYHRKASTGRPGAPRRRWLTRWPRWCGSPRTGGLPAAKARRSGRWKARVARP